MKIVIVDDNLVMRKVLSTLFESLGHQVVAALEDGTALAACVKQHSPDLVCLDYNLPGQNGLQLLAELQSWAPQVDIVIITASDDPDLVGLAANAGASGFLRKPFSRPQILAELKQVEETRRVVSQTASQPVSPNVRELKQAQRSALIVDDSASIRMLLKGILEGMGLTVVQMADNAAEGIKAAKRYLPALVCLDVEMPGMSGLQALPQIRAVSPHSSVVMITGNANKDFVKEALAGGVKGYILKPVRPSYVEELVKKLLV